MDHEKKFRPKKMTPAESKAQSEANRRAIIGDDHKEVVESLVHKSEHNARKE